MLSIVVFYVCLTVVLAYALWRGGEPERLVAIMLVVAAVATSLLPFHQHSSFHHVEWGELAIDATLCAALVVVAAYADRFWPIYMAAIQLLTTLLHLSVAYEPHVVPLVYERLAAWMAYPVLAILAVGVARHQLRGDQFDWSWQ